MNTTSALLRNDDSSGFLRRAGRAVLGSAAILIVGAGATPAAQAATAGSAGARAATAHHSASATGPASLPVEPRASVRLVVGEDGSLTRSS
ncbi:hypothetical protein [Flexivirga endophytica]|nr:hypothetical protein [Flexivirga endophytica]